MQIEKNKVVSISYTLKNNGGKVLDSNDGKEPMAYIQGIGNLIPGLEEQLEGKGKGDKVQASVAPEKGYGVRNADLIKEVPAAAFPEGEEIKAGMRFNAQGEQGPVVVTVTAVSGDTVTVDGNHPLAGENLHFDVEIMDIREATAEELEHGHVHGPGGHQH